MLALVKLTSTVVLHLNHEWLTRRSVRSGRHRPVQVVCAATSTSKCRASTDTTGWWLCSRRTCGMLPASCLSSLSRSIWVQISSAAGDGNRRRMNSSTNSPSSVIRDSGSRSRRLSPCSWSVNSHIHTADTALRSRCLSWFQYCLVCPPLQRCDQTQKCPWCSPQSSLQQIHWGLIL